MTSKQTAIQLAVLVVLIATGAGLLMLTDGLKAPQKIDTQLDVEPLPTLEDSIVAERIVQMYADEDYPTAQELSPELEELLVNTFTATDLDALKDSRGDAMVLIENMQFELSDEFATLVAIPTRKGTNPKSCGVDGLSQMCVLFSQRGDQITIADIFQTLTKDGRSSEWWNGSPIILEILSMPFAGDILLQDDSDALGLVSRGWTVVDPSVRTRQPIVRYTIHESAEQADVSIMEIEGNGLSLQVEATEVWSEGAATGAFSHVVFKDGAQTLLSLDGQWQAFMGGDGTVADVVGPDEKAMLAQPTKLILGLGNRTLVYDGDGEVKQFYELK